jgi:hypothetical protein
VDCDVKDTVDWHRSVSFVLYREYADSISIKGFIYLCDGLRFALVISVVLVNVAVREATIYGAMYILFRPY